MPKKPASLPTKPVPFEFVLDAIESRSPLVRPMFGCFSVYVGDDIVLFLRDRGDEPRLNGVWVATVPEHRESLAGEFAVARDTYRDGEHGSKWLILPAGHPGFEADALRACELILRRDPRVGHPPAARKARPKASRRPSSGR